MPAPRDIGLERRLRAAATVRRLLGEVRSLLARAGVPHRILDGSATAAEIELADEQRRRAIVRAAIRVERTALPPATAVLNRAGFAPSEPRGDVVLMQLARRRGRAAIHVLYADDLEPAAPPPSRPHPGSAEAARERGRRIASAWADATELLARTCVRRDGDVEVIETFELELLDASSGPSR